MSDAFQSASVSPEAPAWQDALRPRDVPERSRRFRIQIGLDPDRPVVMSGHQPAIWHAGILAKWAAMVHAARALDAQAAWLVVDQDVLAPSEVRWPAIAPDQSLRVRVERFGAPPAENIPACAQPIAIASRPGPADGAPTSVARGLHAISNALARYRDQHSAAAQVAHAVRDLAGEALGMPPPVLIFVSMLAIRHAVGDVLERLEREAPAAIAAYNRAAAAHPNARIRTLDAQRLELPLWRIVRGRARERFFVGDSGKAGSLAPRALLTTLLARLHACDLFIHGTGGGDTREGYDLVMQDWAHNWLGPDTHLAPAATVTATCRLDLGAPEHPNALSPARAAWEAHHARHDPALLGDAHAARRKRELVAQIAEAHPAQRRDLYLRMHTLLAEVRGAHAGRLLEVRARANELAAKAGQDEIRLDRTWAFPLLDPATLDAMQHEVARRIGAPA